MLRAIMALLFAFLFLVVGIPVLGIEWLYGKINKKGAELSSLRIVQWAFSTIIGICGTDVIVKGAENIPAEEAVVYVGNHRSIFDVVIGYTHCPGLTGFIAKDNLEKIPLLRVWMRRLHCLFLDRTNPRDGLRVILAAIDDIKRGISIFVFPEERVPKPVRWHLSRRALSRSPPRPVVPLSRLPSQAPMRSCATICHLSKRRPLSFTMASRSIRIS